MTNEVSHGGRKDFGRLPNKGVILRLAVALGLVAALAFQWCLVDWLTPFLLLPFLGLLCVLYVVALGWELAGFFRRKFSWGSVLSLATIALCGLAAVGVPFTNLWLKWNFDRHEASRESLVGMVQSGALTPNVAHNPRLIALPPGTPEVSQGGNEIIVEEHDGNKYVFFFTYRGILDNYSGFLHVPTGGDPRRFTDLGKKDTTQFVPVRGRWVYVAHW